MWYCPCRIKTVWASKMVLVGHLFQLVKLDEIVGLVELWTLVHAGQAGSNCTVFMVLEGFWTPAGLF